MMVVSDKGKVLTFLPVSTFQRKTAPVTAPSGRFALTSEHFSPCKGINK